MTQVTFVHGLWIAKDSWAPWMELFEAAGYEAVAPAWPGEAATTAATRADPQAQAGKGLAEIVDHFAAGLPPVEERPVVVGHSFGGLIAQILLARKLVVGAVAIDPAPIKGVRGLPLAQLRSALPVLGNPRNRNRAKALTRRQFRYGFGNALSRVQSDYLWERWSIPSPGAPLFEVASANSDDQSPASVDVSLGDRGPLLMIAGSADHTVPAITVRRAFDLYLSSSATTDLHEFPGKGHSLTIDSGWREIADDVLAWLAARDLDA
jgi:non-heme chloroperoxidase